MAAGQKAQETADELSTLTASAQALCAHVLGDGRGSDRMAVRLNEAWLEVDP